MSTTPVRRIYRTHMFGGLGDFWSTAGNAALAYGKQAVAPASGVTPTGQPIAPTKSNTLLVVGGVTVVGLVAYFLWRKRKG